MDKKDDDKDFFSQAMADVKPLKGKRRVIDTGVDDLFEESPKAPATPAQTTQAKPSAADTFEEELSRQPAPFVISHHDYTHQQGHRPGFDYKTRRKMGKGPLTPTRHLDLHGYTLLQARQATIDFLDQAWADGQRCVLIIHGKGGHGDGGMGVIKNNFHHWLEALPFVLAYQSAQPQHGGYGASYVLLKRKRQKNG